jgi:hypothetical protein
MIGQTISHYHIVKKRGLYQAPLTNLLFLLHPASGAPRTVPDFFTITDKPKPSPDRDGATLR